MIPLEKSTVARLESFGERFEILVDPDKAALVRQGQAIDIEDVVAQCVQQYLQGYPRS
jgi:ribosome maturation protein SDO1